MILPIILAGGSGSRLWPLSREFYPKQFINILGQKSMLQETLARLEHLEALDPVVVCNHEQRFLAAEQIRLLGKASEIILEPEGKNTAPAVALAALRALEKGNDPILLILAADHIIKDLQAFTESVRLAEKFAEQGKLVTLGIDVQYPETGYGYIKKGNKLAEFTYEVSQFVEKPDPEFAKRYFDSGEYFWNSGMFLFRASVFLSELEQHFPQILDACSKSISKVQFDGDFVHIEKKAFTLCPSNSVDYAVMEKTQNAVVVSMDAGWDDVGSWSSIWSNSEQNPQGNLIIGDAIVEESNNCLIRAEDRLVSVLGLEDIVVIDTKDAVLVAHKKFVQNVKRIVERIKNAGRSEWKVHREVFRPWGKYDLIDVGAHYQVKRITVNPGSKLSLQRHRFRAEHWIVVSGIASVTNGENTFLVNENESTFIPIGQLHALENPGEGPLELIEVQTGTYFGEDDIVRYDDFYGRND